MPSQLAALIIVAFIIWLFRRDSKEFGAAPITLWIPLFWVTINMSRALVYWFSSGLSTAYSGADSTEGSAIDRSAYLFMMVLGIIILSRRKVDWSRIFKNCKWLFLLYLYYLIATTWSEYPFVSFKRWIKDVGDIVMILLIITEKRPAEAIHKIFIRSIYILIPVSVLFVKYYPELGRYTHRYTYETFYSGVTTNKNALGLLTMMAIIFLVWQMIDCYRHRNGRLVPKNVWPELILVGMSLWLLKLAHSSTGTACLVIGLVILFLARLTWVRSNLKNFSWCVLAIGILMITFTVSDSFRGAIAGILGRDVTLTDRTLIWEMALNSGTNPIIGGGFKSFFISSYSLEMWKVFKVESAHNGYLEVFLNTGWIGVVLLSLMLLKAGRHTVMHFESGRPIGYLFMAIFWLSLIYNYTESTFSRANIIGFFLMLLAAYAPSTVKTAQLPKYQ